MSWLLIAGLVLLAPAGIFLGLCLAAWEDEHR